MSVWQELDDSNPPLVVLFQGAPKTGKTDLACRTFPEPVYLIDTELRGKVVARKYSKQGRDIRWIPCRDFTDVLDAVKAIKKDAITRLKDGQPPGTVIIDSGTDLQPWSEDRLKDKIWEKQKAKAAGRKQVPRPDTIYPLTLYKQVFAPITKLVQDLKDSQFHVLITTREKAEYKDDEETGRMIMDGYKRFPYLSDLHLKAVDVTIEVPKEERKDPKRKEVRLERKYVVLRNAFTYKQDRQILDKLDWEDIERLTEGE